MRNELETPFWRNALETLPAHLRGRYYTDFVAAERWELTLAALIEGWSRAKAAVSGLFHTSPRARHGH